MNLIYFSLSRDHLTLVQNCGRYGHMSKSCSSFGTVTPARPPAGPVAGLAAPIRCFRCNGINHYAKDCTAPPFASAQLGTVNMTSKTCYKCQKEGHVSLVPNDSEGSFISFSLKIARDCPQMTVETSGVTLGSHSLAPPVFKICYSCGKEGHVCTSILWNGIVFIDIA